MDSRLNQPQAKDKPEAPFSCPHVPAKRVKTGSSNHRIARHYTETFALLDHRVER